jgi:hypothetical protein
MTPLEDDPRGSNSSTHNVNLISSTTDVQFPLLGLSSLRSTIGQSGGQSDAKHYEDIVMTLAYHNEHTRHFTHIYTLGGKSQGWFGAWWVGCGIGD